MIHVSLTAAHHCLVSLHDMLPPAPPVLLKPDLPSRGGEEKRSLSIALTPKAILPGLRLDIFTQALTHTHRHTQTQKHTYALCSALISHTQAN